MRGPRLDSQLPQGGSQLSVSLVPGDPMCSGPLGQNCMHTVHKHTCRFSTHIHKELLGRKTLKIHESGVGNLAQWNGKGNGGFQDQVGEETEEMAR